MNPESKGKGWLIALGVLGFIIVLMALSSFSSVPTGKIGIVTRFGKVTRTVGPGLNFIIPIESVTKMDVQTQKEQAEATAASVDQQNVFTTVAVNYHVDSEKAVSLFTNVGEDYKIRIIDPAIQEVVKAVTARYTANDLLAKRPQVSEEIKTGLSERLNPYNISVSDVSVVNFKYSDVYEVAIENKVTAEQNALASKNKLEQATYEAQAIKVKSEAANNEKYIQLQQLEVERSAIEKWNGVLPAQFVPGSAMPFINLHN